MNHFLEGFVDELIKTSAHPAWEPTKELETVLGLKVKGTETPSEEISRKAQVQARRGAGLKKTLKKTSAEEAGAMVREVLREAGKGGDKPEYKDTVSTDSDDPRYGGGIGNLGGKKAPAFTDKVNPTDAPSAFGTGCGVK
jgi:hypothetical protein